MDWQNHAHRAPWLLAWGCLAGLVISGGIEIFLLTPDGAFSSPDSVDYATAARSLVRGEGLLRSTGEVFALWPPLYPLGLALGLVLGLEPTQAARAINAASLGLSAALIAVLLRSWVRSDLARCTLAGSLLVAWPPLWPALWAWSESLYSVLLLVVVLSLWKYLEAGGTRWFVGLVAACAAACLQRYAGAGTLGGVALGILLLGSRPRLRTAAAFLVLSAAPLAAWLGRNAALTGTLTGRRPPSVTGVYAVLSEATTVFWFWLTAQPDVRLPGWMPWAVCVFAVGGTGFLVGARWQREASLALVLLSSVGLAVASSLASRLDGLDRLLAPLFAPCLVLAVALGTRLLACRRAQRAGPFLFVVAASIWCAAHARHSWLEYGRLFAAGRMGFTSHAWRMSPLIAIVRQRVPPGAALASNSPAPVALWAGRPVAPAAQLEDWDAITAREVYVAWFDHTYFRRNFYSPADLRGRWDVERLDASDDGALLRVTRRPRP